MKSPKEFSQAIGDSAKLPDAEKTILLCDELIASLFQSKDDFPASEAERIMTQLRGGMFFSEMIKVGNAFVLTGRASFTIHRQFAQAAIEKGEFDLAIFILTDLVLRTGISKDDKSVIENAEAKGLLGRVYKQLFINSAFLNSEAVQQYFEKACSYYYAEYLSNKKANLWHGVNALALACLAKREELHTPVFSIDIDQLANEIINTVDQKDIAETALSWDYATASEAFIALGNWEKAFEWIEKYVAHSNTTAFAINGTLRQFREVWQLVKVEYASPILSLLNIHLLKKRKEAVTEGVFEASKPAQKDSGQYESNFGDDTFKTLEWYLDGVARCNAVARIGIEASKGIGTGFLLRGSMLSNKLGDDFILLTNEHVINDDPNVTDTLRSEDVKVIFEKVDMREIFQVEKIYWISERNKLDVAIVQFYQKDQLRINEIGLLSEPFPVAKALPIVERTQRIYIIGHPGGETLSLSLQDNELLDHEAPAPRIHYRTPTEHGSSGSPVFNRNWKLIGIHHKGNESMPRLNNLPGTYEANEGIWIQSIINALQADGY